MEVSYTNLSCYVTVSVNGTFRDSIPSTFRLTAYLLAILHLKLSVSIKSPKTRYPVVGLPSGKGFPPA